MALLGCLAGERGVDPWDTRFGLRRFAGGARWRSTPCSLGLRWGLFRGLGLVGGGWWEKWWGTNGAIVRVCLRVMLAA